jgi:hypothetical protein
MLFSNSAFRRKIFVRICVATFARVGISRALCHIRLVLSRMNKVQISRVEAGMNTSTVIPASRKRRRKGNPVVSGETVMYGYESSSTLTTERFHYKLQTRPLVTEGAPRRRAK